MLAPQATFHRPSQVFRRVQPLMKIYYRLVGLIFDGTFSVSFACWPLYRYTNICIVFCIIIEFECNFCINSIFGIVSCMSSSLGCEQTVFQCCPDEITPAKGWNYRGCPGIRGERLFVCIVFWPCQSALLFWVLLTYNSASLLNKTNLNFDKLSFTHNISFSKDKFS